MRFIGNKIKIDKTLNQLDKEVLEFTKIISRYANYVIVSGYVAILLGRSRTTEDVDIFVDVKNKKTFENMYRALLKKGYWCLNAEDVKSAYVYLQEGISIRFAKKNLVIPNFEIKIPKDKLDRETLRNATDVVLPKGKIKIAPIEMQIAFKRYYLKSPKDIEDAYYLEELFKKKINKEKILKYKKELEGK